MSGRENYFRPKRFYRHASHSDVVVAFSWTCCWPRRANCSTVGQWVRVRKFILTSRKNFISRTVTTSKVKLSLSGESTVFENTGEITAFSELDMTHDDTGRSCQLSCYLFSFQEHSNACVGRLWPKGIISWIFSNMLHSPDKLSLLF